MKKLIYFLFVLLSTFSTTTLFAEEEKVDVTVLITNDHSSNNSDRPRSIIQDVIEATIDTDLGMLAFYFNENLSNITITIKNANGNIVASTVCNTNITTSTYLNVPTAAGTYSIDIYGDCVTAYGEYDIN